MEELLGKITQIKIEILKNEYGEKLNKSQQNKFFSLQKELYNSFKEVYKKITKQEFKEDYDSSYQIKTREESIYF